MKEKYALIPPNDLNKIIETIKKTRGFDFSNYAKESFQRRIKRILVLYNLTDIDVLLDNIENDIDFYKKFIKEITVNTTEAFRDPTMWLYLRNVLLENFKKREKIAIWHAGCSIGLEVYSMCILLKEMGLWDRTTLTATDINSDVIEKAKSGVYDLKEYQTMYNSYIASGGNPSDFNYVVKQDKWFQIDTDLISKCTFKEFDLVGDDAFDKFDIILCRNVIIYFDEHLQEKVFGTFYNSLNINGKLILGKTESMNWSSFARKFDSINPQERIYKLRSQE